MHTSFRHKKLHDHDAAAAGQSGETHEFGVCGGVGGKITQVSLVPDPPVAGKELSVMLHLSHVAAVASGTATLDVSAYGIQIASKSFQLCDLTACPLAPPQAQLNITYPIPGEAPVGVVITVKLHIRDEHAVELACAQLSLTIGGGFKELMPVAVMEAHPDSVEHSNDSSGVQGAEGTSAWLQLLFSAWMRQHNAHFTSRDEFLARYTTFQQNHARIVQHNEAQPAAAWSMGHNAFSHLTHGEFLRAVNLVPGSFRNASGSASGGRTHDGGMGIESPPASVDWVAAGAVVPVKNQQQCGSCWAFSAVGALEGAHFLKTGQLVSLSEQNVVDCDTVDQGCSGGLMDNAFDYAASAGGLCTEAAYPYTATSGSACVTNCARVPHTAPSGHTDVAQTDAALMAAIAQQPVAVAIEADQSGFQFYSSGVFTGECGDNLDHGVLAVGYGPAAGVSPAFYKVRNSWGASWGDAGYVKIARGKNLCGILNSASFPTL